MAEDEFDELLGDGDEPVIPGLIKSPEGGVPTTNDRWDAPTIHIDSVQGAMLSTEGAKISFIEHFLTDDSQIQGRYVVNIAMSVGQMKAVGELFVRLASEMENALANAK